MSANLGALIPELQGPARDLRDAAGAAGFQPRVTSTLRSTTEQARLYRRFQQGLQPLPVAPPGTSAHEFGFAFDMITSPMEALLDVGYTWEQWGGVWGGAFNDPVHFEYPGFKIPAKTAPPMGALDTINAVKDFVATLPIPFGTTIVLALADYFYPSEIVHLILNPSQAVKKYPWLAYLGPPFVFY